MVMTTDPLEESDDEFTDENARLDYGKHHPSLSVQLSDPISSVAVAYHQQIAG